MKKSLCLLITGLLSLNSFIYAGPGCHEEDDYCRDEVPFSFNFKSELAECDSNINGNYNEDFILDEENFLSLHSDGFSTYRTKDALYSYNDVTIGLDKYGYKHIYLKNTLDNKNPSKDILLIDTYKNDQYVSEKSFITEYKDLKKSMVPVLDINTFPGAKYPDVNKLNGIYFENVKASSYLTEGKKVYNTDGLLVKYFNSNGQSVYRMSKSALPWVEGKSDEGIGESLEFDIVPGWIKHSPDIYILNGYVDPLKPALFRENNRIKKALIETDTGYKKIVEFRDQVEFTGISLEQNTSHVKITILEVYKGTKYNDTCVSAIDIFYGWWNK